MVNVSKEALMEVFGTPGADDSTVRRWKLTWRDSERRIRIRNFNSAVRLLTESGVDPLFYQFYSAVEGSKDGKSDANECYYVTFYKDEHYVFFKLHTGIS